MSGREAVSIPILTMASVTPDAFGALHDNEDLPVSAVSEGDNFSFVLEPGITVRFRALPLSQQDRRRPA